MNNMKQQMTEAIHVLSEDINAWNKRIEQLNYPRWVLSKDNIKALVLNGTGNFNLAEGAHYPEYLIEFETFKEATDALEAMKSSPHLFAVSEYIDFNTLSPTYMPVVQSEIDKIQGWIDNAVNQIKFFQDMLGIPNVEGTQIIDIPEQQTDVVLEYGILVEKEGIDPFVYCGRYHPTYKWVLDEIVNGWVSITYPNATYSVIARSKGV